MSEPIIPTEGQTKIEYSGPSHARIASGRFLVCGFEKIGTWENDRDQGVVRVSQKTLRELRPEQKQSGRNLLVRITTEDECGRRRTLVRLVRAATASSKGDRQALKEGQIAIQYDDRISLGITRAGLRCKLIIQRSPNPIFDSFMYLNNHTSASIKMTFQSSIAISFAFFVLGLLESIISAADNDVWMSHLLFGLVLFGAGVTIGRIARDR